MCDCKGVRNRNLGKEQAQRISWKQHQQQEQPLQKWVCFAFSRRLSPSFAFSRPLSPSFVVGGWLLPNACVSSCENCSHFLIAMSSCGVLQVFDIPLSVGMAWRILTTVLLVQTLLAMITSVMDDGLFCCFVVGGWLLSWSLMSCFFFLQTKIFEPGSLVCLPVSNVVTQPRGKHWSWWQWRC